VPSYQCLLNLFFTAVRKVRMSIDMPSGCSFSSLPVVKLDSVRHRLSNVQSTLSAGWESVRRVRVLPEVPANSSFSKQSLAYMQASAQYIKQVSGLLKVGVTTLRSTSTNEAPQGKTVLCISCKLQPIDINLIVISHLRDLFLPIEA
jgi:hypothetical protein